jgi:hypothetical protein
MSGRTIIDGKVHAASPADPARMREALLKIEWLSHDSRESNPSCPICRRYRWSGHADGCVVGAGLGRVPELPGVMRIWDWKHRLLRYDVPITDAMQAMGEDDCRKQGTDPFSDAPDPCCPPDSIAAREDKVPAWYAALHDLIASGAYAPEQDEIDWQPVSDDDPGPWSVRADDDMRSSRTAEEDA